ncbi:zinc-ribbon domain-containing protein [Planomicrobium sp. CPCC 101110]|uniref:TcaA NTF2-like domain-containing protein n=1 Tax=Planomicrobium sp. CPCC 101110 TaxID=2599619 RepID=UPI0016471B97|nr:zinc-ribbon domain-containing protein [Planomicrobium sp. CPCC 101110]
MEKFCQECGNKLEANQTFCPECGTPIQNSSEVESSTPASYSLNTQPVTEKVKKPMSLKKKVSLVLVAILAIGLGAGHYMIEAKTSPQEKVNAFLSALAIGDTEGIMKEIIIPENIVKDDQVFTEYLESQDLEAFQSRIYEAASGVESDGIARFVSHENGEDILRITQEKFIGLYPVIEIEAIPVEVKFLTDIKNAEYQLGDKTIQADESEIEIGAYLPGVYQSALTVTNGEIVRTMNEEQEVSGDGNMTIEILEAQVMVKISSDDPNATVYIDEKSTGKTVDELSVVGPVSEEDTISVHVERKNKKGEIETSIEETAYAGDVLELPIYPEEEETVAAEEEEATDSEAFTEEALADFITHFRSAYQSALNSKDYSIVEDYLLENSETSKEVEDFIADIGTDYYLYEFITDNVTEYDIQEDAAFITTYEEFDFTNHLDEVTNYKRNKRYKIVEGEDMYKIAEIDILDTEREK